MRIEGTIEFRCEHCEFRSRDLGLVTWMATAERCASCYEFVTEASFGRLPDGGHVTGGRVTAEGVIVVRGRGD